MDKKEIINPVTKKSVKLPVANQLDTVSPATRLLEKRRLMYEKQEEYEQKKKEFKQNEAYFREQEKELREKDLDIQSGMIKFSTFLQDNEKKKKRADQKIKDERESIDVKEKEIDRKLEYQRILEEKSKRIESKALAMKKYEQYLDNVRDSNLDEYQELQDILSRYKTLKSSNVKLSTTLGDLEKNLDDLKNSVSHYEKTMKTEIMTLNNDIANLQQKFEAIEDQKNKLKSEAEESSSKKLNKVSDLARILMAIDNLESRCLNRKERSALKYPLNSLMNLEDPKNFNLFVKRKEYAKAQLHFIEQYLRDFKAIIDNVMANRQDIKLEIKKKKDNNEII
eukprot:403336168